MNIQSMPIQKITKPKKNERSDFVIKYSGYFSEMEREAIEMELALHQMFGTLIEVRNPKEELIALARWNQDKDTFNVLDTVIHPKYRNKKFLKGMLLKTWLKMPHIKKIKFAREKYNGREKVYEISKFLGVKNG